MQVRRYEGRISAYGEISVTKMAATDRRRGSSVERYAWTFFVFVGAVLVVIGLTDLGARGATFGQGEAPTFDGITGTSWESIKSSPAASQIDCLDPTAVFPDPFPSMIVGYRPHVIVVHTRCVLLVAFLKEES
jgi:hypothetical protein